MNQARIEAEPIVRLVRDVLGPAVAGAYLHGSAGLGGLRPDSDLDVLVVTSRRTADAERRALVERLLDVSGARARLGPARPVELCVVAAPDLRPWRYPPRCELLYGEWLRDEFQRGELPEPGPNPDVALLVAAVLAGDGVLAGPPPRDLLAAPPPRDLTRAMLAGVPGLLADLADDTRNVVLTLARIRFTLATGRIGSKDEAAGWLLDRLPAEHRAVLGRARAGYLGERERWDDLGARVGQFADHVVGEITRAAQPG